jgi:membrane protein implicated in regulation of membrane protease activity
MNDQGNGGGKTFLVFAILHLLCCGIPLLLLSGVSLAFLAPTWPVVGVTFAIIGIVGFIWYLKRGCPTCKRNEGGCNGNCKIRDINNKKATADSEVKSQGL